MFGIAGTKTNRSLIRAVTMAAIVTPIALLAACSSPPPPPPPQPVAYQPAPPPPPPPAPRSVPAARG